MHINGIRFAPKMETIVLCSTKNHFESSLPLSLGCQNNKNEGHIFLHEFMKR